ncbi:hypothetical protein F4779DRAFT_637505 [Xylariaceae sp. FL0662B]|nr:hypothetical protein F4779DRAFT_637505 [Xylariaceae sp. FL0662B]
MYTLNKRELAKKGRELERKYRDTVTELAKEKGKRKRLERSIAELEQSADSNQTLQLDTIRHLGEVFQHLKEENENAKRIAAEKIAEQEFTILTYRLNLAGSQGDIGQIQETQRQMQQYIASANYELQQRNEIINERNQRLREYENGAVNLESERVRHLQTVIQGLNEQIDRITAESTGQIAWLEEKVKRSEERPEEGLSNGSPEIIQDPKATAKKLNKGKNPEVFGGKQQETRKPEHAIDTEGSQESTRSEKLEWERERQSFLEQISALQNNNVNQTSHVFSLVPYPDPDPRDIWNDFDNLVVSVTGWVSEWIEPVLTDGPRRSAVIKTANDVHKIRPLRTMMTDHPDLIVASCYSGTDTDVVIALIMRWLHAEIFSTDLYGVLPNAVGVLTGVQRNLEAYAHPPRDLIHIRNFRANAFAGILSDPDFSSRRKTRRDELARELGLHFIAFEGQDERVRMFDSLGDEIIRQALAIQEKIAISKTFFEFDFLSFHDSALRPRAKPSAQALQLFEEQNTVHCYDVMADRRRVGLSKKTAADTQNNLYPICAVMPRITSRYVGRNYDDFPRELVYQPTVLVAWGSRERRQDYLKSSKESRNLMNEICSPGNNAPKREKGQSWSWPSDIELQPAEQDGARRSLGPRPSVKKMHKRVVALLREAGVFE